MLRTWQTILQPNPPMGFTGSVERCVAGTTSATYRRAQLAVANAFRSLAGVAPTAESGTYSATAQAAALIMAANQRLSHQPPASWRCHTALGAEGAGSSNLFLGVSGPEAIVGYVADPGDNNTEVGHRRWILCPASTEMGFGDVPGANATKVFPTRWAEGTAGDAVAWPYPGLLPVNLAGPRGLLDRHMVMYPGGDVNLANASVSVRVAGGPPASATIIERSAEAFCAPAVVWVTSRPPVAGERWTVTVSGVTDSSGAPRPTAITTSYIEVSASAVPARDGIPTQAQRESVFRLYRAYFLRDPDLSGHTYWASQVAKGGALDRVSARFAASSEFTNRYGRLGDAAFVDLVYRNVLGRPADPAGRSHWITTLTRGRSRGAVMVGFSESREFRRATDTA